MIQDSVSVTVSRGSESWQFFAFTFASVTALGIALIDDLWHRPGWPRAVTKLLVFAALFYLLVVNAWMRNHILVSLLQWLKIEHY